MRRHNKAILQASVRIAKAHKASAILFNLDCLDKPPLDEITTKDIKLIPVTQKSPENLAEDLGDSFKKLKTKLMYLPAVIMSRVSFTKVAVVHAISEQIVKYGETIVIVTGLQGKKELDNILVLDTESESEMVTVEGAEDISESVNQEIFQSVLHLSLELAHQGREGKPVGTIFVLGDEEKVMQLSKQMIINPFKGYTEAEQNILNPELKETIREFSAIDGAFIVSKKGCVLSAGRYLNTAASSEGTPRGLGSRHIAAEGITALTKAVAIVISESSGDVRIYKEGRILMEVEKSHIATS